MNQQELQTTVIRVKTPKNPDTFDISKTTATLKKGELFFNPKDNYLYAGNKNDVLLKTLVPINRVNNNIVRVYKASQINKTYTDIINGPYIYNIFIDVDNPLKDNKNRSEIDMTICSIFRTDFLISSISPMEIHFPVCAFTAS